MENIIKLDIKDRKILRELDMDARMNIKVLAKKVRLSRQVVQYRINRMKKEGLFLSAITVFDSATVNQKWFRVVIQLQKIIPEKKSEFVEYFKSHPHVMWLGEVGGNWDFVINFISEDQFTFNIIFEEVLEEWGKFVKKYEILTYINVRDQARQYLLPEYEKQKSEIFHAMKNDPELKLDELDEKLIKILAKNAWHSASELGKFLGVNYKTVQERMKHLEKKNLILGYRLPLHARKIGAEAHMIFLGIHSYQPNLEKQLYEFLRHKNVTFLVKHLGVWRFGLEVEVSSSREFQDFLIELRTRFGDMISTYETFPIFHDHVLNYFPEGVLR
ncbi:MAG: AsnC family transcriptional regulator [Candidatus Micrarchaeota archaeon]